MFTGWGMVLRDVSQGSVLGHILSNIVISELPAKMKCVLMKSAFSCKLKAGKY